MRFFAAISFLVFSLPLFAGTEYVNFTSRTILPCNSAKLRHYVGGGAAIGKYVTEKIALEGEFSVMEDKMFLLARSLVHFSIFEEFNLLFGYERIDPYFSLGVATLFPRGQSGPEFGLGAYYYLSESWALRVDGSSVIGVEGDCDAVYSIAVSLQRTF
jgi:hypothetical protein